MAGFSDFAPEGVLTINSLVLNCSACVVGANETGDGGLLQLWGLWSELRGEDRVLPSAAGVISYPRRRTPTRFDLTLRVNGDVNFSNVPYADDRVGLQTNLATIKTSLIDTVDDGTTGTVTASLTRFTGSPLTGPIHVLGLQQQFVTLSPDGYDGSYYEGTLQIAIPAGQLV